MIHPQLAVALDWERIKRYPDYTMEPKLDGVRCIVERDESGVQMYTRSGNDLAAKLPHLRDAFESIDPPFVLDGEVGYIANPSAYANGYPPIMDFNSTMRVIGSDTEVAIEKQNQTTDSIHFIAFDMLRWTGQNLVAELQNWRRRNLETFCGLNLEPWMSVNYIQIAQSITWDEATYNQYVEDGGEGVILKNPEARYAPGKRPANNWYKVKKYDTIDGVITGYTEGQGKYTDQIGAILFDYNDRHFKCSGMDDSTRSLISQNREWYLGRVIEIRHFGFVGADQDGLRFPQFIRFRFDKEIG
jgi:ATP-dependent DNA ligase